MDDSDNDESNSTSTTTITDQSPPPQYWCHQCKKYVKLEDPEEIICPDCASEFIEEVETPPTPAPAPTTTSNHRTNRATNNPFTQHRVVSNNNFNSNPMDIMQFFAPFFQDETQNAAGGGVRTNIFGQLQRQQQQRQQQTQQQPENGALVSDIDQMILSISQLIGGNTTFAFDGSGGFGGANGYMGNPNDYFQGGDWQAFLNRMFQASIKKGTPPASKNEIDNLKRDRVDQTIVDQKVDCAVCKDEFKWGDDYIELPCQHLYHPDCILPWLEQHNSCPVCRHELKTDDKDYENEKEERERQQKEQQQQQQNTTNTTTTTTTTTTSTDNNNNNNDTDEELEEMVN